ncbi:hypothetical protein MNBD_PLANCTO02-2915 [hydrothermal vent metagenome]|uniref:Uncharacterized protein n=1 Tax=hydrothermal vent metagenome TaxID=652676 RepID=A0A3B1E481_9ZZZZ
MTKENDEKLDRIYESIQQMNINLESARVSLISLIEICSDHEKRIRGIERWQQNLTPIMAVLTFALGAIFTQLLVRFIS